MLRGECNIEDETTQCGSILVCADDSDHTCCYVDVYAAVLSVNRLAHNSWCHHLFTPTIASRRARSATPTVYLAMSRSGGKPVKNIQEYERAHRVPMSPDKNGQPRPGYRHDFPDCQHFVYLLPRADAEEMQVGVLIDTNHLSRF